MADDEVTARQNERVRSAPSSLNGPPDIAQLLEQGAQLLAASRELLARIDVALGIDRDEA